MTSSRRLGLAVAVALAGCTSFSPDGGFSEVARLTRERVGQVPAFVRSAEDAELVRTRMAELLSRPITADSAVEIALLNNPGLQARFRELGIAEADLVQAGRLRNPVFGFVDLASPDAYKIERSLVFELASLITLPGRLAIQRTRFEQAQLEAAADAVMLAAQARRAWIAAVASRQQAVYAAQVGDAADAAAELARRMMKAGNFSRLARMREETFSAEATAQLARARHREVADREQLLRVLGLSGNGASFALPDRLPDLPGRPTEPADAEGLALRTRLDVQAAERASAALAQSLGLTRVSRFTDGLDVGYANMSERGEARKSGYELAIALPVFDLGDAQVARAEARYRQAVSQAAQVAVDARSQVRETYSAYRTSYELARHYRDEVVPLARRVSEEQLYRYNGMLIGTFELLADARDRIRSVTGAIEALRDFWVADTDLQVALTGGAPAGAPLLRTVAAPTRSAGGGH